MLESTFIYFLAFLHRKYEVHSHIGWAEWEKCGGDHSSVYSPDGRLSKPDSQNSAKSWVGFPPAKHDVYVLREATMNIAVGCCYCCCIKVCCTHRRGCFLCTYHCVGSLHSLLLVHRGTAAGGHTGAGWGTGRAGSWARGLHQDGGEGAGCPGQRHLHWSHRGHAETGGSCLRGREEKEMKETKEKKEKKKEKKKKKQISLSLSSF